MGKDENYIIPDHFSKLTEEQRKEALDLFWSQRNEKIKELPLKELEEKFKILSGMGVGVFIMCFILIAIVLGYIVYKFNINMELQTFLLTCLITSAVITLCGPAGTKEKNDKIEQENLRTINKNVHIKEQNALQQLAFEFIQSQYKDWISEMDKLTLKAAMQNAKVESNYKQFSLFVFEPSFDQYFLSEDKFYFSYIFSNGLISIIKGVTFDISKTSYNFVNSNSPPKYFINPPSEWTNVEVYYQDVVTIAYEPSQEQDKFTWKNPPSTLPVEGYIKIGLSDGTKISIPSNKNSSDNFIEAARVKVRAAKKV